MWQANQYSVPRTMGLADEEARVAFLRKVYGLLFTSTLVSVGVGSVVYHTPSLHPLHFIAWLGAFGVLLFSALFRRSAGMSLGALYLFTGLMGFAVAPTLYMYNTVFPLIGLQAAAMTLAVFGGLTSYVLATRKDFSYIGGFLSAALIALIVVGFIALFFPLSRNASLLYSIIGALIFAVYILYDTSKMLHNYGPGDAPIAALGLYLDLLNLFLFILSILSDRRRN